MSKFASIRPFQVVIPLMVLGLMLALPEHALASTVGASDLPITPTLDRWVNFLLGPLSLAFLLTGVVGAVWSWMKGGEMGHITHGSYALIVGGAILAAIRPFIGALFGISTPGAWLG